MGLPLFACSARAVACASILLVFAACASPVPDIDAGADAAFAVALAEPIAFTTEGGPLDAGEPPGDALPLTTAIESALQNDARVQMALARVHGLLHEARQEARLPNPFVNVVFRVPSAGGPPAIDVGLAEDLLPLLSRPSRVAAASDRLRAGAADVVSAVLDSVAEVRRAYVAAQALDAALPGLTARRELLARLASVARSRLEHGEGTQLDVATIEAQAIELEVEIAERSAENRAERLALALRIGRPSDAATWRLDALTAPPDPAGDDDAWIATALARRPEIVAIEQELRAREEEAAAAGLVVLDDASLGIAAEREVGWSVGPSFAAPLPLFDRGEERREIARARLVETRHALTDARRAAVADVRAALASDAAARASLAQVRDEWIPLESSRREQVESVYLAGHADLTALLLAEQDLRAAEAKRIDLERRVVDSWTRLERAAGGTAAARDATGTRATEERR